MVRARTKSGKVLLDRPLPEIEQPHDLLVDDRGRVWIASGFQTNSVLYRVTTKGEGYGIEILDHFDSLSQETTLNMVQSSNGTVWIG